MPTPDIGIAVGGGWARDPDDSLQADLDEMASIGFTWVRFDTTWPSVESKTGSYYLDRKAQIVQWAADRGLRTLGVMGYTPPMYRQPGINDAFAPPDPRSYEAWRAYCRVLFATLAPLGVFRYEPWNEPNHFAFWHYPNPVAFARLVKIAHEEAAKVDSRIRLVCGALSPAPDKADKGRVTEINPPNYVTQMYAAGIAADLGAVSIHPYMGSSEPDTSASWSMMIDQYDQILAVMTANGHGTKKIWGTEFGYRTLPQKVKLTDWVRKMSVTEDEQARLLSRQIEVWRSRPNAGPGFVFNWRDLASADVNGYLGIHRADGTPKPSVAAIRDALRSTP